jgi:hypothetical protein
VVDDVSGRWRQRWTLQLDLAQCAVALTYLQDELLHLLNLIIHLIGIHGGDDSMATADRPNCDDGPEARQRLKPCLYAMWNRNMQRQQGSRSAR